MHHALGTVHQLHVSGIVILTVMIEVMAFWRQITKAVIALVVAAVIAGHPIASGRGR